MYVKDIEKLVIEYQKDRNEEVFEEILRRNYGLLYQWVVAYSNLSEQDLLYSVEDLLEEGQTVLPKPKRRRMRA